MLGVEPVTNDSGGSEESSKESRNNNARSDDVSSEVIEGPEDSITEHKKHRSIYYGHRRIRRRM